MIGHKKHSDKKEIKDKKEDKPKKDLKQAKIEELTDLVKRIQAEFENFKKREENERKVFVEFSNSELIQNLLPVLDSIDSAKQPFLGKKAATQTKGLSAQQNQNFVSEQKTEEIKGIELIEKQLNEVLGKYGLREITSIGKKFNPEFHECLMKENNSEKEDGIVLEELQKGFMLKDKVLRHSKVKINSKEEIKNEN